MKPLTIMTAALLPIAAAAAPPETPREPVTDRYHGREVVDPYRWLEGSDAPDADQSEALDRRVAQWTEAQNARTRKVLDNVPGRAELETRLRELLQTGSIGVPAVRGDRYFYAKREGTQAQPVLYVRRGLRGEPRELLNVNELYPDGLTTLAWFEPSPDGERVAFGLYSSGDENATLYILETGSGEWLAEEIPGKVSGVQWMPDNQHLLYHRLAELDDPYSGRIKFHEVGRHHRQDATLFKQYEEGPLATTWGPYAFTNEQARWLMLGYWTGTSSNDLWFYDLAEWRESGKLEKRMIVEGEDATFSGSIVGDTLYMETTLDAPNGRVMAVDLENPARDNWREVIPERDDRVLETMDTASGHLVVNWLKDAHNLIEVFDLAGRSLGQIELPGLGSASITLAGDDTTEAFVDFESFNEPDSIYHADIESRELELWERPEVPVDPGMLTVRQVRYASKDGTRVPMFIVHRKGLQTDAPRPTLLSGYGGFNISRTPAFNPALFPWLEAGGIYALANLRGGGEYGEAWHRAGMLENKQNVFDDFIAASEWLIDEGYTDRDHLGIAGGSNGGLLTGAALVQRPELYSAVISAVPLLDMLRYQHFLMARYWVPEYGSAEDASQFEYLLEYSPYHNVEQGTAYPATFLTAGAHDTRVHAMHARKMAARLQHASSADPREDPILLWVEQEAGHGQGKPLHMRIRDNADLYSFAAWQLGLDLTTLNPSSGE